MVGGKATPPPVELRCADRPGAGAAGALLAPRLRAAAGDEAAGLGAARSGAARVQLRAHRLVDQVRLHLGAEDRASSVRSSTACRRRRAAEPLGAATVAHLLLSDLDEAVLRAGYGALDQQQVPLGVDRVHRQADLRHALAAHAAGHLHALEDARRSRRRADRARLADVVRAVDRAAVEVVPLDRPGEALADRDPRDLDLLAGLEGLDRDRLADRGARDKPRNSTRWRCALDPAFVRCPSSAS